MQLASPEVHAVLTRQATVQTVLDLAFMALLWASTALSWRLFYKPPWKMDRDPWLVLSLLLSAATVVVMVPLTYELVGLIFNRDYWILVRER